MGSVSVKKDSVAWTVVRKLVQTTAWHWVTVMRVNVSVKKATLERTALSSHVQITATKGGVVSTAGAPVTADMRVRAVQN